MVSRRHFLGGVLAASGAGCAGLNPNADANSGSVPSLFGSTISAPRSPPAGLYPLSAQQIHDLPYATLGVRVGDHQRAVVVLATVEGRRLRWVSADRVEFVTEDGLDRDLGTVRWLPADAGQPLRGVGAGGSAPPPGVYREMDLRHANEHGLAVSSRFEGAGDEVIEILGVRRPALRIDEVADVRAWRWKTRNRYWLDPDDGRILRSRLQFCPEMPPIEMEVLKPAVA